MRIKLLIIIGCFLTFWGCKENAPEVLEVSSRDLSFTKAATTQLIAVESNSEYRISGNTGWCYARRSRNSDSLTITVTENITRKERSTEIKLVGNETNDVIRVSQQAAESDYLFEIPIIFHVLYEPDSTERQNIDAETLNLLVQKCNEMYRNSNPSVNMNVQFVMATQNPEGKPLPEPGIERIQWPRPILMGCKAFMDSKDQANVKLMWPQKNYINITIFTFKEEYTMGISHLPYVPAESPLAGLFPGDRYFTQSADYPHSIALNNRFIHDKDAFITLTHEMGHYLGLLHAFSVSNCFDDDYCKDTPNYNRKEYDAWLETQLTWSEELFDRTDCKGNKFTSTNIMDYDYSYLDRFTPDQYKRIRHVLENSPLIPGPKATRIQTKGQTDFTIPPIRSII